MRNYLKAYAKFGLDLQASSDPENWAGACPFPDCGKDFHFSVGKANGAYRCFRCGKTGNLYTFLREWHSLCLSQTTAGHYKSLWKLRGIHPRTLAKFQLAWDKTNRCWLLPIFKLNAHERRVLVNLKQWRQDAEGKSEFHGTPTCSSSLFNQPALFAIPPYPYIPESNGHPSPPAPDTPHLPVWVCEGEWDALALLAHNPPAIVVAIPGAHSFKEEWIPWFADREVVLLFDNDEAGQSGSRRVGDALVMHQTSPRSVHALDWSWEPKNGQVAQDRSLDPVIGTPEIQPWETDDDS